MPKKSVLDMSRFERLHHSLGGKTFRAIVLFCLLLSLTAAGFGFTLYVSSVRRDYRVRTWQMSKTASALLDQDEIRREAEEVIRIYESMTEEEQAQLQDKHSPLLSRFDTVRGEEYEQCRSLLRLLQENNGAIAAYTALMDPRTNRQIFLADSDPKDSFCPPGSWDELEASWVSDVMDGKYYLLDDLYGFGAVPAAIINMEAYGYRCMAGTRIADIDGYALFVFFDTDMNQVSRASSIYFWQYVTLILVLTLILVIFAIRHMKRTTIEPIDRLSDAAMSYVENRGGFRQKGGAFSALDIRTGDEIEKLSEVLKTMEEDLGAYLRDLTTVTAEKERISTELNLATRIQADMLPNIYPAFPDRAEFDIYGVMDPAREVGGDFYDFFLIDEDHLCMIMADVSGKGVPAALFMMASKIILDNNALMGKSPAQILTDTNTAICSANREEMFVTVWLGILEISTGRLTAASAGHEYPAIRPAGGRFEILKDKHGFVIGGLAGAKYTEYELQLRPGARLFLYTDGLTEAENDRDQMFGSARMLEALNEDPDGTPEQILRNVQKEVDAFVKDAEQFDDLTMLCLKYIGPKEPLKEITLPASKESIAAATEFVVAELEAAGCPLKTQMQIELAVDEVFTNIASYAYAGGTGKATVRFEQLDEPRAVRITFIDSGIAYDPLEAPEPDVTLSAEERQIGGLGIFLVRKTMDDVTYERAAGRNILRITKKI